MQRCTFLRLGALAPLLWSVDRALTDAAPAAASVALDGKPRHFAPLSRHDFLLDGRSFQIR